MKKIVSLLLTAIMLIGVLSGFAAPVAADGDEGKQSPVLQAQVDAGTLPPLAERIPTAEDVYVEVEYSPEETPVYGGTFRTYNSGMWYYGPICEEPLFRLNADGTVEPNVAKSYEVSEDGLVYTIKLREGMKWSDGTPFTATDCVYYYNYVLVSGWDYEAEKPKSYAGRNYSWYKTVDPADGKTKPAQVRYVDDTTFTITLYAPKPTMLQAICIDNKWMFCPKEWYKGIVPNDPTQAHWSGETDLKLIGGEDLPTLTDDEAVEAAKNRSELYTFDNVSKLGDQLGYRYWQYAGRPTLRPWNIVSALTDTTLVFERNPYYWKIDKDGRQLPYIDNLEFTNMDQGLWAQEAIAGHLDITGFDSAEFPTYKASEAMAPYTVQVEVSPSWSNATIEFNQSYKDLQYRSLFQNIDFRHAVSIAVDRNEVNEILYNGMLIVSQSAAPAGTADYIEGAGSKWVEQDVAAANALLDGIEGISKSTELNADGYRTWVGGDHNGEAIVIEAETRADAASDSQLVALLAKYFKAIGIHLVESANTDNNARNERFYLGDTIMAAVNNCSGSFSILLRPDALAANRNNNAYVGKFGLEHPEHLTPEAGSGLEELVNATLALQNSNTVEEAQAAAARIAAAHNENTWVVGFVVGSETYHAVNNRIHNFRQGFVMCDELRFLGYAKPYTWFIQE